LQWEHQWDNQVSSFRAPVERAVATLKTWRILFTDYRRPLNTFKSPFGAAIGLYFFKESLHKPRELIPPGIALRADAVPGSGGCGSTSPGSEVVSFPDLVT
jgi:hypothetical protein